jgi:hypothetical protein
MNQRTFDGVVPKRNRKNEIRKKGREQDRLNAGLFREKVDKKGDKKQMAAGIQQFVGEPGFRVDLFENHEALFTYFFQYFFFRNVIPEQFFHQGKPRSRYIFG